VTVFHLSIQHTCLYRSVAFALALSLVAHTVAKAADTAAMAADGALGEDGSAPRAVEGKEIFEVRCAVCHGVDGRGDAGRELLKVDMPDFTDCSFASREPDSDFAAVIHGGGPSRGFNVLMPVWSAALSEAEIARVLSHLRSFCGDDCWPRGELNLPRPLLTEKAFPEDEAVVTTFANVNRGGLISTQLLFEKRIGSRAMVEIELPVVAREWTREVDSEGDRQRNSKWYSGVGDLAIGAKYAFFHSLESGSIASAGAEVKFPTGNDDHGIGKGKVVFEPYLAAGQILPGNSFVQGQLLGEITTSGGSELYLRAALGKTFTPRLHGRTWTPMVELITVIDFGSTTEVNLDVVPQIQVPLNRRQHISMNVGVWIPATRNDTRATRVGAYLLWDWFDGGFFEGW
jgi:mono/diheme cytochrome c family protein